MKSHLHNFGEGKNLLCQVDCTRIYHEYPGKHSLITDSSHVPVDLTHELNCWSFFFLVTWEPGDKKLNDRIYLHKYTDKVNNVLLPVVRQLMY